jgi:hypothetical protein
MIKITDLTQLEVGDKIYAPKLDKYFNIVDYSHSNIFREMLANLSPSNENPNEKGFTATLSTLIELNYYKC